MNAAHPKDSFDLIGHAAVERLLLDQALARRLPGAYLLIGAPGIGKATMAWRLARFLLSGAAEPAAEEPGLFGNALPSASPSSLFVPKEHPAVSRMLAGSHADFLRIEREWDEKKKAFKTEIAVDAIRRIGAFLSQTAGEGRWRVILIDPAEALNVHAANALLKWLEEPPADSLFLLVSNRPGDVLATIRSRCRTLALSLNDPEDFGRILHRSGIHLEATERDFLHRLSGGSPGLAQMLRADRAETVYAELLGAVSMAEHAGIAKFAEKMTTGKDAPAWETLSRLVARFTLQAARLASGAPILSVSIEERQALEEAAHRKPLDYWLEVWEKCTALLDDAEHLHLNKKHALLTVLLALAGRQEVASAMG